MKESQDQEASTWQQLTFKVLYDRRVYFYITSSLVFYLTPSIMIGPLLYIIVFIVQKLYVLFIKSFRFLYYLLGYSTTEHELAKAILQMSDGCPKKYMPLVMLLYSMVYIGCFECGQACNDVFKSLHELMQKKSVTNPVSFNKIRYILQKYSNASKRVPLTNEILLSLEEEPVNQSKEYKRNLQSYLKCWLMGSSMYCRHQLPLKVNNAPNQKLTLQESVKSKRQNTNKHKEGGKSLPRRRYNTEKDEPGTKTYWVLDHLFYPTSLLYALQKLPERRLIHNHQLLEDVTTLNIHVVTSSPLLETEHWEVFMHGLPKLNRLNLVFIIQNKMFKKSFNPSNWEVNDRIITYSVQHMQYHMYFSSQEYTDPDIVVVFSNMYEMSSEKDDIHSQMSYANMTNDPDTVVVLMDATEELVRQGIKAINAIRPVDQLVLPQIHRIRGYGSNQLELDYEIKKSLTENNYFTCLNRK